MDSHAQLLYFPFLVIGRAGGKEDEFPVTLIVAWKKIFQQVHILIQATPAKMFLFHRTIKSA